MNHPVSKATNRIRKMTPRDMPMVTPVGKNNGSEYYSRFTWYSPQLISLSVKKKSCMTSLLVTFNAFKWKCNTNLSSVHVAVLLQSISLRSCSHWVSGHTPGGHQCEHNFLLVPERRYQVTIFCKWPDILSTILCSNFKHGRRVEMMELIDTYM